MKTSILVIVLSVMCTLPALAQSTVSVTTGDYWDAVLSDDGQAIQLIYSGSRRVKSVKLKQVHPFTIGVDASNQPVKALFSPGNLQYTPNPNKGDGKYRFANSSPSYSAGPEIPTSLFPTALIYFPLHRS